METLLDWIATLDHWGWWVFALLLVVLEIFAPSTIFLWLGISAGVVGIVSFFMPDLTWQNQWLVFAVLAVASVFISRFYLSKRAAPTDEPALNRRALQYVGRRFKLDEALIQGRGKIAVGDGFWTVSGPDLPAGSEVVVTGAEGVVLIVEAAKDEKAAAEN